MQLERKYKRLNLLLLSEVDEVDGDKEVAREDSSLQALLFSYGLSRPRRSLFDDIPIRCVAIRRRSIGRFGDAFVARRRA